MGVEITGHTIFGKQRINDCLVVRACKSPFHHSSAACGWVTEEEIRSSRPLCYASWQAGVGWAWHDWKEGRVVHSANQDKGTVGVRWVTGVMEGDLAGSTYTGKVSASDCVVLP